jgi:hypothetical protein
MSPLLTATKQVSSRHTSSDLCSGATMLVSIISSSGKRCDYRVGPKPSTAANTSLSPLTKDITQSYWIWGKLSLNILRFILQFELISSKSVFQKYNFYISLCS